MSRTRTHVIVAAVSVALLLGAWPVAAHHNLVTQFDIDKPVTLRGTLTKMEWVNPHGWIYLDVDRGDGQVESWAIETGSVARMAAGGLKKADFQPGIEIIVIGFAGRKGAPEAAGFTVTFADRQASFLLGR